jgi:hypothetical protein
MISWAVGIVVVYGFFVVRQGLAIRFLFLARFSEVRWVKKGGEARERTRNAARVRNSGK